MSSLYVLVAFDARERVSDLVLRNGLFFLKNSVRVSQKNCRATAAIVRKYVGIRELTPTIVNEFVKKIIVHAPDKSSGHRRQKIELVWNFIGEVNLPGAAQTVERQRKGRTA